MLSAKGAERWAFAASFMVVALISLWFGGGLINRSLETRLIREVLFDWQRLGQRYAAGGGPWPVFEGNNHVAYMQELIARMRDQGLISPRKARRLAFAPRLKRIGRPDEGLFVLLLPGRMVIFGLSQASYARIDTRVDGAHDPARGRFTGRRATNGNQMIGHWQL
jgi:hypothetical protein